MALMEMSTSTPAMGRDDGDVISKIEGILSPEDSSVPEADDLTREAAQEEPTEAAQEEPTTTEEELQTEEETAENDEEVPETEEEGLTLDGEQLAELLGVPSENVIIDDDGGFSLRTKTGDEVKNVSVDDLVKSFQTQAHVTQKSKAVAEEKRKIDQLKAQAAQQAQQQLGQLALLTQAAEKQLSAEYESINWDELRRTNPAEWSARKQEFQDRVNGVNQIKSQGLQALQQHSQQQQQAMQQMQQQILAEEAERLVSAIPQWSDPGVAEKEHSQMQGFLVDSYGFSPEDVNGVTDHRLILLARDAQKYRASKKEVDTAAKKIRKLPKIQKPQARGVKAKMVNKTQQDKKRVRLKQTGSIDDTASVLMDMI